MNKNAHSNSEIDALVADFTSNLSHVIRRSALEQVMAALDGGSAAPKLGKRGRPAGSKNKKGRVDHEKMGERLLSYVKSKPGLRADQIAKVFHTDVNTMRPAMKNLILAKKVKTKGLRRGMTYAAV